MTAFDEVVAGMRRQVGSANRPAEPPKEYRAQIAVRTQKLRAQGVPYPEAAAREQIRREDQAAAEAERRRAVYEQMAEQARTEREQKRQAAVEAVSKPARVRYLPNGRPAPGTTINDVIQDTARSPIIEKLRVDYYGGWDDLVEMGMV